MDGSIRRFPHPFLSFSSKWQSIVEIYQVLSDIKEKKD